MGATSVQPGARVPLDGIVVDGSTAINESALTGESKPVSKNVHSRVFGGTMNQKGSIEQFNRINIFNIFTKKNKRFKYLLKLFRNHGIKNTRYMHIVPGHNFRLTNLQASMGYSQIKNFNKIIKDSHPKNSKGR